MSDALQYQICMQFNSGLAPECAQSCQASQYAYNVHTEAAAKSEHDPRCLPVHRSAFWF